MTTRQAQQGLALALLVAGVAVEPVQALDTRAAPGTEAHGAAASLRRPASMHFPQDIGRQEDLRRTVLLETLRVVDGGVQRRGDFLQGFRTESALEGDGRRSVHMRRTYRDGSSSILHGNVVNHETRPTTR